MSDLLLHPTNMAQWQQIICAAQNKRSISLCEAQESYLVFLLMRFVSKPELASSVVGLDFLNAMHERGHMRRQLLREIGDKCLLLAGLFPGRAQRKRVRISYFVALGQSAYAELAQIQDDFIRMAEGFVTMLEVLHAVRPSQAMANQLTPLAAHDLMQDLDSQCGKSALAEYTDGFVVNLGKKGAAGQSH